MGVKDFLQDMLGFGSDSHARINPDSGKVQEEGFWGWDDTDHRVEPDSGKVQEEGFWGWNDTGQRIDPDSGRIQEEGFWGWKDTEYRIDPDSGQVQEEGFWGWKDTGYHVDSDTGEIEEDSACFVTTACVQSMGLSDNCTELHIFRSFRDKYVKNLPNGDGMISEYYAIAPSIVTAINRDENAGKIYSQLYEELVLKTIRLLYSRNEKEALDNCVTVVTNLKEKYL